MKKTIKIPSDRPLAAKRIMEILTSAPKLAVLKTMLEKGEVSASDLSNTLGVKLPTILSHLSDLVKTGLVTQIHEGRRKKYRLTAEQVVLEIDLNIYLRLEEKIREEELREIEYLAYRYAEAKRSREGLPLAVSIKDVSDTLGVDRGTAIAVVDYINTFTDRFIELLVNDALEELRKSGDGVTLYELSKKLNIHYYWAALIAQKLVSKGYVVFNGDRIVLKS